MKITHLTSVHPRHDIRIFVKECVTLAAAGHEVTLLVADGQGDEAIRGVRIHDVGAQATGRFMRMTSTVRRLYQTAMNLRPDVVHFHDPELIPAALRLKQAGIKVVYDVHEDVPRQILSKLWIPAGARNLASIGFEVLEEWAINRFDAVVTATPHIRKRFEKRGVRALDVCNFPILEELMGDVPWEHRRDELCYIGAISRARGIECVVDALPDTAMRLNLVGSWSDSTLKATVAMRPGWAQVNHLGFMDRKGVIDVLTRSKIGLVTLLPTPNHIDALPIKLFEYMAAGIPVIASDFPVWRKIVHDSGCGVLVDPTDPIAIAVAVNKLMGNEARMRVLGEAGKKAVVSKYSWVTEGEKLVDLYDTLWK